LLRNKYHEESVPANRNIPFPKQPVVKKPFVPKLKFGGHRFKPNKKFQPNSQPELTVIEVERAPTVFQKEELVVEE